MNDNVIVGAYLEDGEDFRIALSPDDAACYNILDENGVNIAEIIEKE